MGRGQIKKKLKATAMEKSDQWSRLHSQTNWQAKLGSKTRYLTTISLSVFFYKMEMILISQCHWKTNNSKHLNMMIINSYWDFTLQVPSSSIPKTNLTRQVPLTYHHFTGKEAEILRIEEKIWMRIRVCVSVICTYVNGHDYELPALL